MTIKRILFMFAVLFQLLAVHSIADYNGPWLVPRTVTVFERDVAALPGTRALDRRPAVVTIEVLE